jgi:hypothetical protein
MSDNPILDAIIASEAQPMGDEFYEDEPQNSEPLSKEEELRQTIADIASEIEPPQPPVKETFDEDTDEDGYKDPYGKSKHRSAEAEMQDRLLTIPLRPKNAPWGSLWVIKSGFIDQIALINITKSEQRALLRQWADIQILSEGDGNKDICESEQEEFVLKIVSYKSRGDNKEVGIRERTAHITQKSIADQTINMPKGETQRSGFLNTILGRKG